MSKVTFEFNLPEETEEFEIYSNAIQTNDELNNFKYFLRNKCKYQEMSEEANAQVEEIYSYFCEKFPNL